MKQLDPFSVFGLLAVCLVMCNTRPATMQIHQTAKAESAHFDSLLVASIQYSERSATTFDSIISVVRRQQAARKAAKEVIDTPRVSPRFGE